MYTDIVYYLKIPGLGPDDPADGAGEAGRWLADGLTPRLTGIMGS